MTNVTSLQNEGYVKFRDNFVKKLIKTPLSSNLQVSSYKAAEMDSKSNFFNAISGWSEASLYFQTHFRSHFVENVFQIVVVAQVPDATNPGQNKDEVQEIGSLFAIWHTLTLDQVFASCRTYFNYSTTKLEAQNLNLSWEFLLANIDGDLRAAVIAEVSRFVIISPDAAQSGPMAFFVIATQIIRSSDALAHNVITGLMSMGLLHFKGENVVQCVATLRNVLLFLGHGTARDKSGPTIMDTLTRCFLALLQLNFRELHAQPQGYASY